MANLAFTLDLGPRSAAAAASVAAVAVAAVAATNNAAAIKTASPLATQTAAAPDNTHELRRRRTLFYPAARSVLPVPTGVDSR